MRHSICRECSWAVSRPFKVQLSYIRSAPACATRCLRVSSDTKTLPYRHRLSPIIPSSCRTAIACWSRNSSTVAIGPALHMPQCRKSSAIGGISSNGRDRRIDVHEPKRSWDRPHADQACGAVAESSAADRAGRRATQALAASANLDACFRPKNKARKRNVLHREVVPQKTSVDALFEPIERVQNTRPIALCWIIVEGTPSDDPEPMPVMVHVGY